MQSSHRFTWSIPPGVYLPMQDEVFPDEDDFGRIFRNNAVLSAMGVPQIAAIMGNCVAGGAYLPVLCDKVLMTQGSQLALAGPALVKAALGQEVDPQELGGATMHAQISGTVDFLESDDAACLQRVRSLVDLLDVPPAGPAESSRAASDPHEAVRSDSPGQPYDVRDLLACIIDRDSMQEYKADYGKTLVCAYARLGGRAIAIVANQHHAERTPREGLQIGGVIYHDSADKAARFVMDATQSGLPLLFIQDVQGFMVGRDSEQSGIIRSGAKLVNAVSNATVPKITLIVGGSFGAGNYALCGKAFDPHFIFAWPGARYAVMGAEQASDTLLALLKRQAERDGKTLLGRRVKAIARPGGGGLSPADRYPLRRGPRLGGCDHPAARVTRGAAQCIEPGDAATAARWISRRSAAGVGGLNHAAMRAHRKCRGILGRRSGRAGAAGAPVARACSTSRWITWRRCRCRSSPSRGSAIRRRDMPATSWRCLPPSCPRSSLRAAAHHHQRRRIEPAAAAPKACAVLLKQAGCRGLRDRASSMEMMSFPRSSRRRVVKISSNTWRPARASRDVAGRLATANAYIGAAPIVEALSRGADIVVTGRVADPSLTVAGAIAEFGWKLDDYHKIAGATVAGHLIECGAQVTGGISTDWLDMPDPRTSASPSRRFAKTEAASSPSRRGLAGGSNRDTVREQLVYELGDPSRYLSPDACVSFSPLRVETEGPDRVRVSGAMGSAAAGLQGERNISRRISRRPGC